MRRQGLNQDTIRTVPPDTMPLSALLSGGTVRVDPDSTPGHSHLRTPARPGEGRGRRHPRVFTGRVEGGGTARCLDRFKVLLMCARMEKFSEGRTSMSTATQHQRQLERKRLKRRRKFGEQEAVRQCRPCTLSRFGQAARAPA